MITTGTASYRKAKSGEWVVFGPTSIVKIGEVRVTKRDGNAKFENVVRVGKTFQAGGVECCYGYVAPSQTSPATTYSAARNARAAAHRVASGTCRTHGCRARAVRGGYCADCFFNEYDC